MSGETWKVPQTFTFVSLFRYVLKFEITDVVSPFDGENPGLGRRDQCDSAIPATHQHCRVEAEAVISGKAPASSRPHGVLRGCHTSEFVLVRDKEARLS